MLCLMGDEVIPALLIAITNMDTQVRMRTIVDLSYRRANDTEVIDALLERLAVDSDAEVRSASALSLARIPDLPDDAMGALVAALDDPASFVGGNAALALGEAFGPRARSAIPALIEHWRRTGFPTSEALTMVDLEAAMRVGALHSPNPYE
jgi:HEAT repeat protein